MPQFRQTTEKGIGTDPVEFYDPEAPETPRLPSPPTEDDVPVDWQDSEVYKFVLSRHNL
jgi:hypothetical protein